LRPSEPGRYASDALRNSVMIIDALIRTSASGAVAFRAL
jgi:hypothetical protein